MSDVQRKTIQKREELTPKDINVKFAIIIILGVYMEGSAKEKRYEERR